MTTALAITQGPLSRVMHVWVDPHYGNDTGAQAPNPLFLTNPIPSNQPCSPTHNTVPDVVNSTPPFVAAPLLHAPFPFQTITAAVNYIPPLPFTSPTSGVTWEFAIVHLMPGTYSRMDPSNGMNPIQDLHNQFYGNKEIFPITVPNRVSIQGTSALNTIIDLGQAPPPQLPGGPAFTFAGTAASNGAFSYISHVSILGGALNANPTFQPLVSAIYCGHPASEPVPCTPTIVNCFLFANGVGVLIDSAPSAPHHVTLINNTIAWNVIGVWNGQLPGPSVGIADLMLLNNIFDATPPLALPGGSVACPGKSFPLSWASWVLQRPGIIQPNSPFEGVDVGDVGVLPGLVDFNAYEFGIYNNGMAYPNMSLPATVPGVGGSPLAPGFDISPYTGSASGQLDRGVLYVRDLLHNGPPFHLNVGGNGTQSCDFDLSPGDFRLSPAVATAHQIGTAPNPPGNPMFGALNPLVDVGISGPFPITMGNGMVLAAPPQTLTGALANGTWPHDLWETDCEGFGNPRIVDHPAFPSLPYPQIDIGADELGLLVIPGYRFGTTMFSWLSGAPGVQKDNRYLWMLGPPNTLTAPVTPNSIRPWFSSRSSAPIWQTPSPENPNYQPWLFTSPAAYYVPRVVDIMPHLLPDVHPYHVITTGGFWPSNPIWQFCVVPWYNAWLYVDPTNPIINPPGAVSAAFALPNFNWLDGLPGQFPTLWGPGGAFGGPPLVATFGAWCQNTGGSQDWDDVQLALASFPLLGPGSGGAGRVTLEFTNQSGSPSGTPYGWPFGSNIQSFMMYQQQ